MKIFNSKKKKLIIEIPKYKSNNSQIKKNYQLTNYKKVSHTPYLNQIHSKPNFRKKKKSQNSENTTPIQRQGIASKPTC